jgi:predicted DNA-binding transcriptional regulator AlpA
MDTTTDTPATPIRALYAQPDILSRGRFSKSHLYNLMDRGHFPKPCLVMGPRFTRWSAQDVDAWMRSPSEWIAAHSQGTAA